MSIDYNQFKEMNTKQNERTRIIETIKNMNEKRRDSMIKFHRKKMVLHLINFVQ